MMTPYTIAHLKLGMTLSELGAKKLNDRLRIFLTNTLAESEEKELPLFAFGLQKVVTEESNYASEVKNGLPVMVVIGNPPYSGVSSNETKYANSLIEKYKVEPGGEQKLQERKHWLNDDYVKFIAFAEDMITKNGKGVIAMITNNGFLDNATFRGMRWQLLKTFDKISIVNLHGNAKKKEVAPDGSKDENVFDIMQGVSIIIAEKKSSSETLAQVEYAEIYGTRKNKFEKLAKKDLLFKPVKFNLKTCYFIPKNDKGLEEYEKGIPINELMPINTAGIVTARDGIVIDENADNLIKRIERFCDATLSDDEVRTWLFPGKKDGKYKAGDSRGWKLSDARVKIRNNIHEDYIEKISYRPFDVRNIYYSSDMVDWPREKIMRNFLGERSEPHTHTHTHTPRRLAMIFNKPAQGGPEIFTDIFVTEFITDQSIFSAMKRSPYVAPLQINRDINQVGVVFERSVTDEVFAVDSMPEHAFLGTAGFAGQSAPLYTLGNNQYSDNYYANFDKALVEKLFSEVEQPDEKSKKVNEYDIFDYIYGSLHSPSYREKYKEFLKTDFPRIPRPKNWKEFWRLVELGRELRELHLMHGDIKPTATYPESGSNEIEKLSYSDNKVWINKTQYFDNVSALAWNFYIGGYQPAQKWLKDRKGRILTFDDINHYGKIITILNETDRIMKEIG